MGPFNHRFEHTDDTMVKVEVNIDDMSPEILGHIIDQLFAKGANDVYYTPIYMKKNRPAVMLSVLCSRDKLEAMKTLLFEETTTFGIRYYPLTVHRLERTFTTQSTPWGEVSVKQAFHQGTLVEQTPEYEDCARIAQETGKPLKHIYQHIMKQLDDPTD